MFQARNVKKAVAIACTAVLLAGGIPMGGLKNSSVMAANPDVLQIPALKLVEKEVASGDPKVYNRQEAIRASYDAKKAVTRTLPMVLTNDSSKSYEFKTENAGVYGFEITEFTQDIKYVTMKLVNKDTKKTVKSLSGCKVGSHITMNLDANTNYTFTVARGSGKKGCAYVRMGYPSASENLTDFIKTENAGILEINDSVVFSGQQNSYTITAEKSGPYTFVLKNIDNSENEHRFNYAVSTASSELSSGVAGANETFTQQLEAGTSYTVTITQKVGLGKYTLALCQPKDVMNLGTYEELRDSLDYTEQENIYNFSAPCTGKYRFGVTIPNNDKNDKHVRLAVLENGNMYQISYTGEEFSINMTAGVNYTLVVSYENCLTPYTLKAHYQKATVALDSGYNKVKDSIDFKDQVNNYTFKAPCDGKYSFYLTDITNLSGESLKTHLTITDSTGKKQADKDFTTETSGCLTFDLKGGIEYTLAIAQRSGLFKYTLNYGEAKPVQDVTNYRYVKDRIQYQKQSNVYTFTAPSTGDYRFQIEDNGKDASKNSVNVTVSGEKNNASVFQNDCTEGKGVLAGLKQGITYKITVDQNTGYAPYTLVVGKVNERTIAPTPIPTPAPAALAPIGESKAKISAFVERIYQFVLNRETDPNGASYWTDELYSFHRTGAEVAQGFIFSPEFENRKTTDREFVTILYKTFFGREPDEAGMNYWLNELAKTTMDRAKVANGFIYSQEWADTCASYGIRSGGTIKAKTKIQPTAQTYAFVERMYTTAMCRNYDQEGRSYWAGLLANFEYTGEQVGTSFFLSDEMVNFRLSDAEYVNRLYKTFMDRESDPDGAAYWLSQMASGKSRKEIVLGFTRSPEFVNKCVEARILPY